MPMNVLARSGFLLAQRPQLLWNNRTICILESGILDQVRHSTKRGGGSASNHGGSPGQRLGLKLFSDQAAQPGDIIIRQRGTQFHPGQHVYMGRDHTLHAEIPGFVRFYRIKQGRKTRRYVGISTERGEKLPRDEATRGRSRYFGLVDLMKNEIVNLDSR
ncbi:ribosomal L27 protein-domain-containing protein [Cantharellus anzutake]|uniref:ribosomal L27 protein-domain-containing protein n=1 Tax=Cantharellus anzutake TaxID=1750568 RepID=UPI001907911A|nr:ribosomal L27 protein-domain-containing protein [Cantharellus anzutake]KAF8334261.1 ribosomal L27 protein-domain-containing protein [Cantharellus anzutake]